MRILVVQPILNDEIDGGETKEQDHTNEQDDPGDDCASA
jgi:hypothetical protein